MKKHYYMLFFAVLMVMNCYSQNVVVKKGINPNNVRDALMDSQGNTYLLLKRGDKAETVVKIDSYGVKTTVFDTNNITNYSSITSSGFFSMTYNEDSLTFYFSYFRNSEDVGCLGSYKIGTAFTKELYAAAGTSGSYPWSLTYSKLTGKIWATELNSNGRKAAIACFNPVTGARTRIAGGGKEFGDTIGIGTQAAFNFSNEWYSGSARQGKGIVFNKTYDTLIVVDCRNHKIKKVAIMTEAANSGVVVKFAGKGNLGFRNSDNPDSAVFCIITDILRDDLGYLYVSEAGNNDTIGNRVRKISPSGKVYTLFGSNGGASFTAGIGKNAVVKHTDNIFFNAAKDTIYGYCETANFKAYKATHIITVSIPDKVISSPKFKIPYTISTGAPVIFSVISGPASIVGTDSIVLSGTVGQVIVKAAAAANNDAYNYGEKLDTFNVIDPVGITKFNAESLIVSPIPSKGHLEVSFSAQNYKGATIRIYNMLGLQVNLQENISGLTGIDITDQPSGVYILVLSVDGQKVVKRIIKQ